jgi:membrane protease YdiL (CAAX protease family)
MKAVAMPLLGAPPVNQPYHYLAGNRAEIPWFLLTILGAGVAEEIVFRGYAFERLSRLLGPGIGVKWAAVLLTAVWFGSAHYLNQGIPGVENAAIIGLVFGAIFAYTGRLFMLMCAHTAVDLAAYALIYWNLESKVAHLIFK